MDFWDSIFFPELFCVSNTLFKILYKSFTTFGHLCFAEDEVGGNKGELVSAVHRLGVDEACAAIS